MKKKHFGNGVPAILTALALSAFFVGCSDESDGTAAEALPATSAETQSAEPAPETAPTDAPATAPAESAESTATANAGDGGSVELHLGAAETDAHAAGIVISANDELSAAPDTAGATNVTLNETEGEFVVAGKNFFAVFSKATGTLASLSYGGNAILSGDGGPKLNAFRAITNNDGHAYGKWFSAGLFDLKHEVVGKPSAKLRADGTATIMFSVRSRGKAEGTLLGDPLIQGGDAKNGVPEKIKIGRALGDGDLTFLTHQIWTVYPDGSIELAANITSNQPTFDLPRLGFTLGVPAKFSQFTFYGRGPQENYSDRESGAFIGIYSSSVPAQMANYTKPQETGNHEDVRWCALTEGKGGAGAIFIAADGKFSAQALPVTATDLLMASNPFKLDEKIAQSKTTTLNLDAGVRGLGGASCGPDTLAEDKILAGPTDFGFIIRPVAAGEDLSALADVSSAGAVPVSISRDPSGLVTVRSKKAGEPILVSVNDGPATEYTEPIPLKDGGKIFAYFKNEPDNSTEFTFPKIEKARLTVCYVSSEEGGNEAASMFVDGDPSTFWHTAHSVTQANYPHELIFDIGSVKKIKGVSYLPRQDGGRNGDVKGYEIFVCTDSRPWGNPVASGEFSDAKTEQFVMFGAPVEARYVCFRAKSSQNGNIYAAGAEFSVIEE